MDEITAGKGLFATVDDRHRMSCFEEFIGERRANSPDAQYTLGLGPTVGAGLFGGANLGGGLFVNREGLGHFATVGVIAGAVANVSAGLHMTLVKGGAEAFLGVAHLVGISVAPAFTVVTLLYTTDHELLGITVEWSLGHALPVEAFGGALKTYGRAWSREPSAPAAT